MLVAIPVDDKSIDNSLAQSFGRSAYFLIYNTETHNTNYIVNNASNNQGGAGIKAAQLIVDSGADVLITPRCGQNAADVLKTADIKIYKSIDTSVQNNFKAFSEGNLSELEHIHAGYHGSK